MQRTLTAWALAAALLAGSVPVPAGQLYIDPLYGYTKTSDVVFGTGGTNGGGTTNLLLDVYQPKDIGLGRVQPNRPAVVIQDGGAWTSGDKTNGRVVTPAVYLAQRGYTVFIADYRQVDDNAVSGPGPWQNLSFSSNGSTMGSLIGVYPSYNVIRAGIEDFATAMTYTRSNAAAYGINPNLIAAAGGSAGAVNVMDLQYNNNPVNPAYRAQAVVSLVGTMYGDWNRVQPGGPPLFMLNNALDPVIWYQSDVEPNLHNRLKATGIYYEQWMQEPNLTDHNVHYEQLPTPDPTDPWMAQFNGDASKDVLMRMRDFLAYHFNNGPVEIRPPAFMSVTGVDSQTVWNLDAAGNATVAANSANGLFTPLGASHDAYGNLLVSDVLQGKVFRVDTANNVSTFANGSATLNPAGVTIDPNGNTLISNYLTGQIQSIDPNGIASLFADSSKLVNSPFATARDAATGATYVADLDDRQIIKIDAAGNASVFADASDGLFSPLALTVDPSGNVFVGDVLTSRVLKFTPAGVASIFADSSSGLVTPTGLGLDSAGNLYVANYLGNNVLKFTPGGVGSVFANMSLPFGLSMVPDALPVPGAGFAAVPEPASGCLAALGVAILFMVRRKRRG